MIGGFNSEINIRNLSPIVQFHVYENGVNILDRYICCEPRLRRGGVISPVHIRGAGHPWLSPSRGGGLVIISDLLRDLWAMPDLTKQMFKQLSLLFHTFSILIMSRESMHV